MKSIKVYVSEIDWCIEEEDVANQDEMESILNSLPMEVELDIPVYDDVDFEKDEGMLEEAITETLSNKYGWLINSYQYVIE